MVLMIGGPCDSAAHEQLAAYVQHRVSLTLGERYIDLTLDLTFFEEWSAQERHAMDADGNGRITRRESESYLRKLAPALSQQLKLRVAGRELDLVPLYDPELDLLGSNQTGRTHHRLRLWFFASTPASLRAADEILIEDRLWPMAKALGTLQAEGLDGCVLEVVTPGDPGFAPARPGEARLFHARCLKAPLDKPGRPSVQQGGHHTLFPTAADNQVAPLLTRCAILKGNRRPRLARSENPALRPQDAAPQPDP